MRTLVVSDLHLGTLGDRALLADATALGRLTDAIAGVDRLVLLGDVVEFREGPVHVALAAAVPTLTALGQVLGPGKQVVFVPGNHDHHLLAGWLRRRAELGPESELGLSAEVEWRDDEPIGVVTQALGSGGASVSARYPGVWLRDDVYAMHGHYLDRHTTVPTFERLSIGAGARVMRRSLDDLARPEDYEAVIGPGYAWIHAVAQARDWHSVGSTAVWGALRGGGGGTPRPGLQRRALGLGVSAGVLALSRAGLGPLRADLSAPELRRAALIAYGAVLQALSARPGYALFGHTHRAGPLADDNAAEWRAPVGARMVNTGSWVHDPLFVGSDPATSPYRPGFAVRLDDQDPPRLVNLLDP